MVKKISEKEFESEVMSAAAAIVDFSATWCGPCKMLAPVVDGLAEEYAGKVAFYNIDVDDDQELAIKLGIASVPTVLFLKNGKVTGTSIGFKPAPAMKAWIDSQL